MNPFETLLAEKNLSVFRVSKETGIPNSTLYELKQGQHTPKASTLQRLADYFGVPVSYFTTGDTAPVYYEDPLTAELAERMKNDRDLRLLFSAARDAKPETLQAVHDVLLALKKREKGEDD